MSKRVAVFLAALAAPAATAQSLSELLPRLISESVTMPSTAGNVAGNPHEAHFLPAAAQLRAPYALNAAIVAQLATFPIGSSSGGFTYTLDEKTGIPQRSSGSFGPSFAERSLTIGKRKLSVGLNFQQVRFDKFEGLDLEQGVRFYLQHNDCCPNQLADGTPNPNAAVTPSEDSNPFFEGDLVRDDLDLRVRTDTVVLFANYGLTDNFDIAAALPVVRVEMDATMRSTLLRVATASNPSIHNFGSPNPNEKTSRESGSASGIGDLLLRAKYRFLERQRGGLALAFDARLPTGDENDLLGTGATQLKGSLIYSENFGRFEPHLNLGYTLSRGGLAPGVASYELGDDVPTPIPGASDAYNTVFRGQTPAGPLTEAELELPDELNYTLGFAIQATPRLTLNADFVGRTLLDVNRFGTVSRSFNYRTAAGAPLQAVTYPDVTDVTVSQDNLTLLLGIAGFKLNIAKTLLLNGNVLFPLSSNGLRPTTTLVVGLDVAF